MESQTKKLEGTAREVALLRQELEAANRRLQLEKEMSNEGEAHGSGGLTIGWLMFTLLYREAIHAKELQIANTIENLKKETKRATENLEEQLKQKASEAASLSSIAERLGQELSNIRADLAQAQAEADRAKAAAAAASAAVATSGAIFPSLSGISSGGGGFFSTSATSLNQAIDSFNASSSQVNQASPRTSMSISSSSRPTQQPESFADLLGRSSSIDLTSSITSLNSPGGGSGRTLLANSMKEKELALKFEHVSELLTEAEEQIQKLINQEKLLKEEIRRYERMGKMENLVSFLCSTILFYTYF
jgi:ElaB/YqjD/DUF883 family membrane-anchored ribosome-binding protein